MEPAAKLGLAYGFDNLRQLVELVGPSNAKRILFTGDLIDADDASCRIGLVDELCALDELEDKVLSIADKISANAPLTVLASKETVKHVLGPEIRDHQKLKEMAKICFDSDDYREGGKLSWKENQNLKDAKGIRLMENRIILDSLHKSFGGARL